MKTFDKDSCIKELNSTFGVAVKSNDTIVVYKDAALGKATWSKIDYLKNHHGFRFCFINDMPVVSQKQKYKKEIIHKEKSSSNKGNLKNHILNTTELNIK